MIPGDERDLNYLTFFLELRKNSGMNLNQEIDLIGNRIRARWVRSNETTTVVALGRIFEAERRCYWSIELVTQC